MAEHGYSKQKLYEAMASLIGTGTLQTRLTFAAIPLFALTAPVIEFPPELRPQLMDIVARLTAKPLSTESGYVPRDLSDEEAKGIAQGILSLFVTVMGGL